MRSPSTEVCGTPTRRRDLRLWAAAAALLAVMPVGAGAAWALKPETAPGGYDCQVITEHAGFPSLSIRTLWQADDGYLWIATSLGVGRFDGVRFTPVHATRGFEALADPSIVAIAQDRARRLWMASDSGAGLLEILPHGVRELRPTDGLPHHYVRALLPTLDGALWVGTAVGLARLREGRFVSFRQEHGLPGNGVRALAQGPDGVLWVGTTRGLARAEGNRFVATGGALVVHSLHPDPDGTVWVGTSGQGLHRVPPEDPDRVIAVPELPGRSVLAFLRDRDGSLWVGTDAGLFRRGRDRFETFPADHPVAGRPIRALFEDRSGGLWVALGSGRGLLRLSQPAYTRLTTERGLSSSDVRSVHEGPDRSLWLASAGGVDRLVEGRVERHDQRHGLSAGPFLTAHADVKGRIWVLDAAGSLFVREAKTEVFRRFPSASPLHAVFSDARGDVLLADTAVHELASGGQGKVRRTDLGRKIRGPHVGPTGRLWLATDHRSFRREGTRFVEHGVLPPGVNGTIRGLMEDRDGVLWVTTFERGLLRMPPGGPTTSYRAMHGLHSDRLLSVLDDDRGRLWINSGDGVFRVYKEDLEAMAAGRYQTVASVAYGDARDGLGEDADARAHPTAWKGTDGRLYFASARGLLVFDATKPAGETVVPVVETVSVNGAAVAPGGPVHVPRAGVVTITYTAPTTAGAERVVFRHRLEGVASDWTFAGIRRTVAFASLPPGTHRFDLQARGPDTSQWSDARARLLVIVAPPVWRSVPFLVLSGAVVLGGALLAHRLRLRRARARMEAVMEERNRIARDMHDTLAQAFVAISVQLEGLGAALATSPEAARERLRDASVAVDVGLEDARRAVRSLRAHASTPGDLEATMRAIAGALSGRCSIRVDVRGEAPPLPEAVEANLLRVTQEALTNAVRHGGATSVKVELTFSPTAESVLFAAWRRLLGGVRRTTIRLRVEDDGRGFDPAREVQGHGLRGMRERAQKLGARISVDSAPGRGSVVVLEMRL